MNAKYSTLLALTVLLATLALAGCSGDRSTDPALANTDPVVFDDDFGSGVYYQPFLNSHVDLVTVSEEEFSLGTRSLKVTVPVPEGDVWYAGGAFTTDDARDLSGYNALTFYARSSINSTLDVAGFGIDNTGASLYDASRIEMPLTSTEWTRVIIPIPNPARLTLERGLFYFSEGYEDVGFTLWFDDVKFEFVDGITNPRPSMDSASHTTFVGVPVDISGTSVTFDVTETREDVVVDHQPAYFDYTSSDELVATIWYGTIQPVGGGTATITAKLDTIDATGELEVNVLGAPAGTAPTPQEPEGDVICLFSDAYDDVPVDTWHAPWEWTTGEVNDMVLSGDNVKVYTDLTFAGIEFLGENMIDAATPEMTHFHMDVWAPSGGLFIVKLVDFGANGYFDDGTIDDTDGELMFNGGTTPPFFSGQWSALEIPLADFVADGLTSMEHLANLVISSSDVSTVIVDNVYFHR